MRRFAKRLCASSQDADDVCHEAVLRLLELGGRLDVVASSKSYALRVVKNVFFDKLRRQKTAKAAFRHLQEYAEQIDRVDNQSETCALIDLRKALSTLSEKQIKVLECVALRGMSYADTASELGIPIGTVSSTLSRVRQALLR